ncbi:phage virion morphogenesis protein [Labrys neptuniae]|uniref:Phage virion morphogenesis protein n=1 Tax=Labrys neptuniae TaxID=376174 RepID=A0ABV3PGR9_9HYPH
MAGTSITIDVDSKPVRDGLKAAADTGRDLSPLMDAIGQAVLTSTQMRFEAQAGPGRAKWAPFAASTLKRMPKRRTPAQLLRDSGRLYSSLTFEAGTDQVVVGTNVVYAGIHQLGGDIVKPEREGSATFIYAKEGAGRTKDGKRVGSKLRFAKASTRAKSKHTRDFTVPEHTIHIPARPYLGVDKDDELEILGTITDFLKGKAGFEGTP